MPIVNGQYVYDQMPAPNKQTYSELTGSKWSKKDWSDDTTAAYNFLLKQQENAYNLELWNLANEYNSPAAQMGRYQDAGLNPNLIYGQQNTTSPLQAAQNAAFRSQGTHAKSVSNQLATIQQMQGLVQSAAETYDYVKYGSKISNMKSQIAGFDMLRSQADAGTARYNELWNQYLMTGEGPFGTVGEDGKLISPRARMNNYQIDQRYWDIERVKFMVNSLLPSQEARNNALTALDKYQLDMMNGKYGAVLDVHTGLGETVDNWVRLIMFMAMARMM